MSSRLAEFARQTTSILGGMLALFIIWANLVQALTDPVKFPRLANHYLRAGTDITPQIIPLLARYDLIVLPAEAQIFNPDLFAELRGRNPDILILAYLPTVSFNFKFWHDPLHQKLLSGIDNQWWLRDEFGSKISIWPGTQALNLATDWASHLARFADQEIFSTGRWDGIFFDEVDACVICRNSGHIDLDLNGVRDDLTADQAWQAGYERLLKESRQALGARAIILINGSSHPSFQPLINGRMFESFPTPWEGDGQWETVMTNYARLEKQVGFVPIFFFNGDSGNSGQNNNWSDFRFGLTSALLGQGYYGYDSGTQNHGQLWWYDEYDVFLGRPTSPARPLFPSPNLSPDKFYPAIWRRDFEKAVILVNASSASQVARLGNDFEKLHGRQDPVTNDGAITSRLTLWPRDGLILLRLQEEIIGANFTNGDFTRILNKEGETVRTGFFLDNEQWPSGTGLFRFDLDGDALPEILVSDRGKITIYGARGELVRFAPYGDRYQGKINLAAGDLNEDGQMEIVTGAGIGGGPHIRIFNSRGQALGQGFFAYDEKNRGGTTVAVADLDGDGQNEIITGAGRGLLPEVRIFKPNGQQLKNFLAYGLNFRGGVNIAAGDLDGDGRMEIVTGAGIGGGPHIRVFNSQGQSLGRGFFPYDQNQRRGVKVGVADLEGDGRAEILALTENP